MTFGFAIIGLTIYLYGDDRPLENESVVLISSSGCRTAVTRTVGSIIEKGLILTVAHGVAGQTTNQITTSSGEMFQAHIVAIDIEQDLALLAIDSMSKNLHFEPLELGQAKAGEDVVFVAYDEQQQVTRTAKIKRRLNINTEDIYLRNKISRPGLEVELKVAVGNSGGPLINKSGQLVGIVWSTSRIVNNRSWATRTQDVNLLLAFARNDPSATRVKPVACTA